MARRAGDNVHLQHLTSSSLPAYLLLSSTITYSWKITYIWKMMYLWWPSAEFNFTFGPTGCIKKRLDFVLPNEPKWHIRAAYLTKDNLVWYDKVFEKSVCVCIVFLKTKSQKHELQAPALRVEQLGKVLAKYWMATASQFWEIRTVDYKNLWECISEFWSCVRLATVQSKDYNSLHST